MPSAGALPAPFITPMRDFGTGLGSSQIDTSTYIEISVEAHNCKLYFTTDGSKPAPFQRKIGGREVTFKYFAPFCLKAGKRTIRAVAVSRDGLLESAVVSKTFHVNDASEVSGTDGYDSTTSAAQSGFFDTTDTETSSTLKSKSKTKKRKSPVRKGHVIPKEAWASTGNPDSYGVGAGEHAHPQTLIPDGPFNPTNYSGTQINVWGAPPGSIWPGMNAQPGMVAIGNGGPPIPQYPVQYGFLTEQMISDLHPKDRAVTLGDIRKLLEEQSQKVAALPPPPKPAIEYKPTYKDPPLNSVSPGNGMSTGQEKKASHSRITFPAVSRAGRAFLSKYRNHIKQK